MKRILLLLMFLAITAAAQEEPLIGMHSKDCFAYILKQFATRDTAYQELSDLLLKKDTKAIYVIKTPFVKDLPDSISGYKIYCLDLDSNKQQIYKAQQEQSAAVVYLSKMHVYSNLHTNMIMPVILKGKNKKSKIIYDNRGYKSFFMFDNVQNQFKFIKTEYFDYTTPAKKSS